MDELFSTVHAALRGDNQRGHDYHADCPFCGKPAQRGQTHFSYSEHGYKCHVCGEGGGLFALARHLGQEVTAVTYTPKPKPIKPPASWLARGNDLASQFAAHPRRLEMWQAYKPLTAETVNEANLGVGILPASRCHHTRLIVPIYDDCGRVVCLRGRAVDCDCSKWLASGGWSLESLPLYNLHNLARGGTLWIVENPIDALMIGEQTPYTGAATLSVSYWLDSWTAAIVDKSPSLVVVAYDNDLPGNGGAMRRAEMIAAWGSRRVPKAAGARVANTLRSVGINAVLYDWKNEQAKSDIGSLLIKQAGRDSHRLAWVKKND